MSTSMKEMVGGCCVCSDERGWSENPLVYCDGQNCTVAVHQACYGIVTVPTGPWFCRKCESQERSARVRCELCPSRDGALKKTDNQGWAHVVCALYIPEVRFGNVTTMEPIILQLIPPERYAKSCYICQEIGKGNRANVGACMQCNKSGCKQQFHVTCAQGLGLLCEEAGNYLDNVKYCGYCQYHYSKLKKGGNVKTIPPYKPITHETASSDSTSSPEKELEPIPSTTIPSATNIKISSSQSANLSSITSSSSSSSSSKQRKSSSTSKISGLSSSNIASSVSGTGSSSNTTSSSSNSGSNKASSNSSSSSKDKDKHSKSLGKMSSSSKSQDRGDSSSSSSSSAREKSKSSKSKDPNEHGSSSVNTSIQSSNNTTPTNSGANFSNSMSITAKESLGTKFTTSNFTETIVVNSESVFGSNEILNTSSSAIMSSNKNSSSSSSVAKKRKIESIKLLGNSNSVGRSDVEVNKDLIKDVSVTLVPIPAEKPESGENDKLIKKPKTENSSPTVHVSHESNLQNVNSNVMGIQAATGNVPLKQQSTTMQLTTPTASTNISSHIKAPVIKEESRMGSNSPYTSSSIPSNTSSGSGTTPSLYVSVPLSTANVPGVSLPSATANVSEHISVSQSSRSSPIVNSHHSNSSLHHQNSALNSNSQTVIERQSPRVSQGQQHQVQSGCSDQNNSNSSTQSAASSVIQPSNSPSTGNSVCSIGILAMESGAPQIKYEKQNLRVTQLQEQEQAPARRSRSQSGDSNSKSRSGKKRSATNVVVSSASSSSSCSSSASTGSCGINAVSSTAPALPVGSSTANEASNTSNNSSVNLSDQKNQQLNRHNEIMIAPSSNMSTANESTQNNAGALNLNATGSSNADASSHSSSHVNNVNMKQLNKKMLRAVQSQYQIQQHQQQQQHHQIQQQSQTKIQSQNPIAATITTTTSSQTTSNDENVPTNSTTSSTSRTPDPSNFSTTMVVPANNNVNSSSSPMTSASSLNNGGLKFTYESQIGATVQSISPSVDTLQSTVKDSPPSSPESEAGSARKRGRKSSDTKDVKLFHNGVHATHMLGNQLNPASSVAQKMSDQLNMEIEDHSVYTQSNLDAGPPMIGVPFPGKQNNTRSSNQPSSSITSMLGGSTGSGPIGNNLQSMEQLLERQWEQGSQFLMEQAQHFDIASLLSCLHQLRTENIRLEEHVNNLIARRDHLLAVNARLAIPLTANVTQNQVPLNNMHMNGPTTDNSTPSSRVARTNAHFGGQQQQQQLPLENGLDFRHTSHQTTTSQTTIRHSSAHSNYSSSTSSTHTQHSVLSSSSSRQQHSITGGQSTNNSHSSGTEQLVRSGRGSSSNSTSTGGNLSHGVGSGSGGGNGNYHSVTQQSAYSNVHQSQLRRDDSQGKPS